MPYTSVSVALLLLLATAVLVQLERQTARALAGWEIGLVAEAALDRRDCSRPDPTGPVLPFDVRWMNSVVHSLQPAKCHRGGSRPGY